MEKITKKEKVKSGILTLKKLEAIYNTHWNICKGKHTPCELLINVCEKCGEFYLRAKQEVG